MNHILEDSFSLLTSWGAPDSWLRLTRRHCRCPRSDIWIPCSRPAAGDKESPVPSYPSSTPQAVRRESLKLFSREGAPWAELQLCTKPSIATFSWCLLLPGQLRGKHNSQCSSSRLTGRHPSEMGSVHSSEKKLKGFLNSTKGFFNTQ